MHKKILIVEDDPDILEVISELLREETYVIATATDGRKALDEVEKCSQGEISLILLDLMLPVMSGREFLQEMRKDPSHFHYQIPVVIMSAAGAEAEKVASFANGYIKKPIDIGKFLRVVAKFAG